MMEVFSRLRRTLWRTPMATAAAQAAAPEKLIAEFLTKLEVEPATDNDDGNWRLLAPLQFLSVVADEVIEVPTGFVTNFASVPRIPIVYELAGDTSSKAATVHDYLYTTHIVPRRVADAVLREASAVSGVPGWRRWLMWAGVRVGGFSHWPTAATDEGSSATQAAVQPTPYVAH